MKKANSLSNAVWNNSIRKALSKSRIIPYVLVSISIVLSNLVFPKNDLHVFISFIVLVPIFLYLKYDSRIPAAFAILLFLIAAIVLPLSTTVTSANQITISAYWLIVVSILCITIDYLSKKEE